MREGAHIPEGAIELMARVGDARDERFLWIRCGRFSGADQTCFGHQEDFVSSFPSPHLENTGRVSFCVSKNLISQAKIHRLYKSLFQLTYGSDFNRSTDVRPYVFKTQHFMEIACVIGRDEQNNGGHLLLPMLPSNCRAQVGCASS